MIGRSHRLEPAPASFPQQAGWGWNCYWRTFWDAYSGLQEVDMLLLRMLAELQSKHIEVHHVAGLADVGQSAMVGFAHHDAVVYIERHDEEDEPRLVGLNGDEVTTLDVRDLASWHLEQKARAGNLSDEEQRIHDAAGWRRPLSSE